MPNEDQGKSNQLVIGVTDNDNSSLFPLALLALLALLVTVAKATAALAALSLLAMLFLGGRDALNLKLVDDGLARLVGGDRDREADIFVLAMNVNGFALDNFSVDLQRLPVLALLALLVTV